MEPISGNTMAEQLTGAARLVVKIGSALLVDDKTGTIRREWLEALADDLHTLRQDGTEILVVSSGAIAVGRRHLGLTQKTIRLEEKQAAAATGQIQLAHAYQEALARHDISVAQILLTLSDTEERRRHLNARSTIVQLLTLGAVPVVNENDTVATTEIRFGDNDRLAARVAAMISADTLVLLSDIDGLYERDPRQDSNAKHIAQVDEINPQIEAMAGKAPTGYSSGGMETKIQAAKVIQRDADTQRNYTGWLSDLGGLFRRLYDYGSYLDESRGVILRRGGWKKALDAGYLTRPEDGQKIPVGENDYMKIQGTRKDGYELVQTISDYVAMQPPWERR